jgi:hypothetical protein
VKQRGRLAAFDQLIVTASTNDDRSSGSRPQADSRAVDLQAHVLCSALLCSSIIMSNLLSLLLARQGRLHAATSERTNCSLQPGS